ncbi:hypothetical protein HPB48_015172 [Haemaphysalis longicornis]|uniref:Uncharacterized protein n=1 Tax=Haemaphysalis longicornis TaxID=44386 RepID=A0A9J6FKE0_HAELO|nr:hypothetical protein HPB48_015172 [Haemaphysalis longicornis]
MPPDSTLLPRSPGTRGAREVSATLPSDGPISARVSKKAAQPLGQGSNPQGTSEPQGPRRGLQPQVARGIDDAEEASGGPPGPRRWRGGYFGGRPAWLGPSCLGAPGLRPIWAAALGAAAEANMSSRSPSPRAGRRPAFLSQPSVISWQSDPTRPPQYLILNPMHIVNLTADKTRSCAVRVAQSIKAFSQRWFSHILLLLVLLAYAAMGAAVFQFIEGPFEDKQKQTIVNARQYIVEDLVVAQRTLSVAGFRRHTLRRLREYETQVRVLEDEARILTHSEKKVWSFWGALFYCGTVFTTIGECARPRERDLHAGGVSQATGTSPPAPRAAWR